MRQKPLFSWRRHHSPIVGIAPVHSVISPTAMSALIGWIMKMAVDKGMKVVIIFCQLAFVDKSITGIADGVPAGRLQRQWMGWV